MSVFFAAARGDKPWQSKRIIGEEAVVSTSSYTEYVLVPWWLPSRTIFSSERPATVIGGGATVPRKQGSTNENLLCGSMFIDNKGRYISVVWFCPSKHFSLCPFLSVEHPPLTLYTQLAGTMDHRTQAHNKLLAC